MKKKPPAVVSDPLSPPHEKSADADLIAQVDTLLAVAATPDPLRMTRHFEWLDHPNVTMDQACWILLGFDPRRPPADHGLSDASPSERHKHLVDRLQCEVAAKTLKPVRATRAAREDRFRLLDVAGRSRDLDLTPAIAEELFDVDHQMRQLSSKPVESRGELIVARLNQHRKFMKSIPVSKRHRIPAKPPRNSPRRTNPGRPINLQLDMTGPEYNRSFRDFVRHQFGMSGTLNPEMLQDDRRALNVRLKAGRPRVSPPRTARKK
jgi:hypothetical protein